MKLPIHVTAALLTLIGWSPCKADIYDSRPSEAMLREATAQCRPAKVRPAADIVGISDPHAMEADVVSLIRETGPDATRARQTSPQCSAGIRMVVMPRLEGVTDSHPSFKV